MGMLKKTVRRWISDECWSVMGPALEAAKHSKAGKPSQQGDRDFLEALIWEARTGSPWRDMPTELGHWHNVYMRFRRWEEAGVWQRFWAGLQQEALDEAKALFANGCICVTEGSNMSSTLEAVDFFMENTGKIMFSPGKASNAGGVATSGLEMSQNSMRLGWTSEEVDARLHTIMINIHKACVDSAARYGTPGNYVNGANIAGFLKVADAMLDQGLV